MLINDGLREEFWMNMGRIPILLPKFAKNKIIFKIESEQLSIKKS